MARTTVRSGQVRNCDLLIEDLADFAVKDNSGLNVTVQAGRVRNDNVVTDKASQPLALPDDATNYVEINSSGVASSNTSAFTAGSIPLAEVVTASADISSITDKRSWVSVDNTGGSAGSSGKIFSTLLMGG